MVKKKAKDALRPPAVVERRWTSEEVANMITAHFAVKELRNVRTYDIGGGVDRTLGILVLENGDTYNIYIDAATRPITRGLLR